MTLDPRHVALVLAISRHGSLTAAATALNVSQPALSNRIAILERELKAKVFDRNRYGVTLTEAGQLLVRHAKAMDTLLTRAREDIELKSRGSEGHLVVGTTPVCAYQLIPQALARLSPGAVQVSVLDGLDEVLVDKLQECAIDMFVGTLGPPLTSIKQEPLTEFSFVLAVSPTNKLAARRSVSLKDISNIRWALPPPGGAFRRYIEAMFLSSGVTFPVDCWTFDSALSLKAAVQHIDCVTIMPRHFMRVEEKAGVLKAIKLSDGFSARKIGLMYASFRPLSPVAERFRQELHKVAQTLR